VTANTRADGEELLALAARLSLTVHTSTYGFAELDRALGDLAGGRVTGSAVITGYPHGSTR
jgi:propanol-preferring alcohol dehydrogenase